MKKRIYRKFSIARLSPIALLGVCSTAVLTAQPAQAGLFSMSEQDEVQAGQQVAAQAEREFGGVLPPNAPQSIRVRALGAQFARLSTRKNIPYTYKVLNNDKVLNAFAAPGGPIYVTKKLVDVTANDAELAYVLGHETAHIEHKHIVESAEKQSKVGLAAGILGSILGRGKSGNIIGTIANIGVNVWASGYSRGHESESDSTGVRWMTQLGYDPRAAISMLGKLGGGGGGGIDKYLSTHPAPKDRQSKVQAQINQENLMEIARKAGGPRLSSNINYGSGSNYDPGYTPTGQAGQDTYPDYSNPQNGTPQNGTPQYDQNQEISLGAPLRIVEAGNAHVIMGPVNGIARWSGARLSNRGDAVVLQRGSNSLELRRSSGTGYVNGRALRLSAAPQVYGGVMYAPLGTLAEGVGGGATLDNRNNVVWLTLGNNRGFVRLPQY